MSGAPQDEERVSEPVGGAAGSDGASQAAVDTLGGLGGAQAPAAEPVPAPAAETLKPGPVVGDGAAQQTAAVGSEADRVPAGAGVHVRYAGRTAVGLVREHNEDNFTIVNLDSGDKRPRSELCLDKVQGGGMLFAVCDGMGGAAAGEVASQMAVDILADAMRRGGAPKDRDALARRLVSAVEEAGKRIFDEAQKERSKRGMGTTATVTVLVDKVLFIAEVGDSRAYLLRNGVLKQLTKDQSLVNQLIEAGHLTEEEAEAFEHSNIILQALGTAEAVQVDLTFIELRKGDRLMLCSDGLSGLVHADSIADAMRTLYDPNFCATKLIEYAEAGGGHDNITVIVVDFGGDDLVEPKDTDSHGYMQYPLPLTQSENGAFGDEDETTASGSEVAAHVEGARSSQPGGGSGTMWYVIGLIALALGAAAMALTSGSPKEETQGEPMNQVAPAAEPAPTAKAAEAPVEPVPVTVNVHTDVEGATLLVNGEAQGPLSKEDRRTLQLTPGAYRFEAQSGGNTVAVSVLTVREDVPTDVFLQMPSGSTDTTVGNVAAAPGADENDQEAVEPAAPVAAPAAAPKPAAPRVRRAAVAKDPVAPVPAKAAEPAPVKAAEPAPKPAPTKPADTLKPVDAPKAAEPAPKPAIPDNPF